MNYMNYEGKSWVFSFFLKLTTKNGIFDVKAEVREK